MPTYDYRCKSCDHRWELSQPITSNPIKKCPDCGKQKAERVIGPGAGIIFKGSGFYQTDYRSDSYKKAAEADKSASSAKSDSKPEAKSETKSDSGSSGSSDSKSSSKGSSKSSDQK